MSDATEGDNPVGMRDGSRRVAREAAAAGVFGSTLAIVMAFRIALLRVGFAVDAGVIVRSICISWFIVNLPAAWASFRGRSGRPARWWDSAAFGALVGILATVLPAAVRNERFALAYGLLLSAAGVALLIVNIGTVSFRRDRPVSFSAREFLMYAAGAVWAFGAFVGIDASMYESTILYGGRDPDRIFHTAIVNMIRTYGVASIGIDGFPRMDYHVASHWVAAAWSLAIGASALEFVTRQFQIFVAPLFFVALFLLISTIRDKASLAEHGLFRYNVVRDPAVWLLLAGVVFGVLPPSAMRSSGQMQLGVFFSQSHELAIPAAMLVTAVSVGFFRKYFERSEAGLPSRFGDGVFLFFVLPLSIALLTLTKVSLLPFAVLTLAYIGWRCAPRGRVLHVAILLCVVAGFLASRLATPHQGRGFALFSFFRNASVFRAEWLPYFVSLNAFWAVVYLAARAGRATFPELQNQIRSRRFLDAELVALLAIAGILPGMLLNVGVNGIYFADTPRWFVLAMLCSVPAVFVVLRQWSEEFRMRVRRRELRAVAIAAFVLVPIFLSWSLSTATLVGMAFRAGLDVRRDLQRSVGSDPGGLRVSLATGARDFRSTLSPLALARPVVRNLAAVVDPVTMQRGLQTQRLFPLVSELNRLGAFSLEEKRRRLLFIPQSYSDFWTIYREPWGCAHALIAPALTGIALLDGTPPANCLVKVGYGVEEYAQRTRPQTTAETSPAVLCAKAARWNADIVTLLDVAGGQLQTTDIRCPRN